MATIKTRPFDAAHYLRDEADMAAYLQAAIDDGDPALLAAALGDVAKARGMSQLARDTGLTREGLYKALSSSGNPSFGTVLKVADAMGYRFALVSKQAKPSGRAGTRAAAPAAPSWPRSARSAAASSATSRALAACRPSRSPPWRCSRISAR